MIISNASEQKMCITKPHNPVGFFFATGHFEKFFHVYA
jgi:hypothetical protein